MLCLVLHLVVKTLLDQPGQYGHQSQLSCGQQDSGHQLPPEDGVQLHPFSEKVNFRIKKRLGYNDSNEYQNRYNDLSLIQSLCGPEVDLGHAPKRV